MNKFLSITFLAFLAITSACKKDENVKPTDDQLEEKVEELAGVYKLSVITSSIALDINQDGIKTTDLYKEIPDCLYDDTFTIIPTTYPNTDFYINRRAKSCLEGEGNKEQKNNFNLRAGTSGGMEITMPYIINNLFYTKLVTYTLIEITDSSFKLQYTDTRLENAKVTIVFKKDNK